MVTRRKFISAVLLSTGGAMLGRPAQEPRWQIGCYTRPWAEHDYRVALDGIAAAGFKHAGLMTCKTGLVISIKTTVEEAVAIGEEVKRRGLEISSVYGGGFPVAKSIDAGITGLKCLIDNAASSESPSLLLSGTNRPELVEDYYKVVAECCDYAAEKGVGLAIKPHGGPNLSGSDCRRLIEKVDHGNFKLWYDPGNIYFYSDGKLNPVDDAAMVDGLVVGVSIKDFLPPKNVNITPGAGLVDFAKVFTRLRRGGFNKGPLLVECLARGDLSHLLMEAKQARNYIEEFVMNR